jgi:hypothetical protein
VPYPNPLVIVAFFFFGYFRFHLIIFGAQLTISGGSSLTAFTGHFNKCIKMNRDERESSSAT